MLRRVFFSAWFAMVLVVRHGSDLYNFHDVASDGLCFYHSLGVRLGMVNGGCSTRALVAEAANPASARYLGCLFPAFLLWRGFFGLRTDHDSVVLGLEELRRQVTSQVVTSAEWASEEHWFAYSVVTGNRITVLRPEAGGVAEVFDTWKIWGRICQWASSQGINSVPGVVVTEFSFRHFLLFHRGGDPSDRNILHHNHFGCLVPRGTIGTHGVLLPDMFYDGAGVYEGIPRGKSRGKPVYGRNEGGFWRSSVLGGSSRACGFGQVVAGLVGGDGGRGGGDAVGGREEEAVDLCDSEDDDSDVVGPRKTVVEDAIDLCDTEDELEDNESGTPPKGGGDDGVFSEAGSSSGSPSSRGEKRSWDDNSDNESAAKRPRTAGDRVKEGGFASVGADLTASELRSMLKADPKGDAMFGDFLRSPIKAVLLHYLNSGLFGFQRWKEYCSSLENTSMTEDDREELKAEIEDEGLTAEEVEEKVTEFFEAHSYTLGCLPSCGACGIRQWECKSRARKFEYQRFYLKDKVGGSDDANPLVYTSDEEEEFDRFKMGRGGIITIPVSASGETKSIELWKARSVYQDRMGRRWHVHQELVRESLSGSSVLVCPSCHDALKKGRRPRLSISNGVDFGSYHRLGLVLPNLHEQLILSRCRMFFAAVKLTDNRKGQSNFNVTNRFKCHAILFPCEEASAVPFMTNSNAFGEKGLFDLSFLKSLFAVYCVDDKMKSDELMRIVHGSTDLLGRSWVLAQWILVLQRLNPYYRDIDVTSLPDLVSKIEESVALAREEVLHKSTVVDDPAALKNEAALGCDVAGNQHSEAQGDLSGASGGIQRMRYSYITATEHGHYVDNEKDFRIEALRRLVENVNDSADSVEGMSKGSGSAVDGKENDNTSESGGEENSKGSSGDGVGLISNLSELERIAKSGSGDPSSGSDISSGSNSSSDSGGPRDASSGNPSSGSSSALSSDGDPSLPSMVPRDQLDFISIDDESAADSSTPASPYIGGETESHEGTPVLEDCDLENQAEFSCEGSPGPLDDDSAMCYSCNASHDSGSIKEETAWQGDAEGEGKEPICGVEASRFSEPVCDFENGRDHRMYLSTTFPHVFMLGSCIHKHPGRFNYKERCHLLHQYSMVPASDRRLIGYLFDMKQRIAVMDGVKAHVNGSRRSLELMEQLLQNRERRLELEEACLHPDKVENWELLKGYLEHLRFASSDVAYGAAEGKKFQWRAMEMNKRYSFANCFLTISPTTIDNPRSIRMSFRTTESNVFPSVFEDGCPYGTDGTDFMDRLRKHSSLVSEGEIRLPSGCMTRSQRADYAMDNPVAYVQENKSMLNDILSILIGLDVEDGAFYSRSDSASNRKTEFYKSKKGVFGHPLYYIGVTEDHSRGTLHWHIQLLSGIPPYVLQRFWNLDKICDSISRVLDGMYTSRVPEEAHIGHLLRSALRHYKKEWRIPSAVVDSVSRTEPLLFDPDPVATARKVSKSRKEFIDRLLVTATLYGSYRQHHRHCSTCHKGFHGERGCRFDYPCGMCEHTCGKRLIPTSVGRKEKNSKEKSYTVAEVGLLDQYTVKSQDILNLFGDEPLIVWETAHPTIVPSRLPVPEGEDVFPDPSELRDAFRNAVARLPDFKVAETQNFHLWLAKDATDRQVVTLWREILKELPRANRLVPSFNPLLSLCTGSHNHASLLGSIEQAKSALFYLVPYQGKSKFPINQALPILNSVLDHVDRNDSQHPTESGRMDRTVKHLLTRTLNKMNLRMEISDYEMAASLLDLPSVFCSDRFSVGHPKALMALDEKLKEDWENHPSEALQRLCRRIEEAKERMEDKKTKAPRGKFDGVEFDSDGSEVSDGDDIRYKDLLAELGFIRKIPIKEEKGMSILVPDVSLYLNRNECLKDLSYYEYLGCIGVRIGKPAMSQRGDSKNRQKHFPLVSDFQGCNDAYHVLLQKQKTPLFIGTPPSHPGERPKVDESDETSGRAFISWKLKADEFAKYFLMLFRPHAIGDQHLGYDWEALLEWIKGLRQDSTILSKFRLMVLHQHIKGVKSSAKYKSMTREYRSRERRLWNDREKCNYKEEQRRKAYRSQFVAAALEDLESDCLDTGLSDVVNKNMRKQLLHEQKQVERLDELFRSACADMEHIRPRDNRNGPISHFGIDTIVHTIEDIVGFSVSSDPVTNSDSWWRVKSNQASACERVSQLRKDLVKRCPRTNAIVNRQQLSLFDLYAGNFLRKKNAAKLPQIVLCHGGPGVGKSVIRKYIDECAKACGRYCLKTSFNAINAIEMGGNTTSAELILCAAKHSNFNVGDFKYNKHTGDRIKDLRKAGFDKNSLVIVEEVSNQAPWHLARLSRLCQAVLNNFDEPFGGVKVLLIGDLTQLGPVKAAELSDAVMDINLEPDLHARMSKEKKKLLCKVSILKTDRPEHEKYLADHPHTIGANLFTQAKWFELTQQQRSEDANHTQFITQNYQGRRITLGEIKTRGYKLLSSEDSRKKEWIGASILVSTNRERQTLTHARSIQYARLTGTVVIRWETNFSNWRQRPLARQHRLKAMEDPCFYEYFVAGAGAFLTQNIQKHLKLTNATAATFHSIVVDDREKRAISRKVSEASPGDVITLSYPPVAVNVEIQMSHEVASKQVRESLKNFSLTKKPLYTKPKKNHTTYVIPLWKYSCKQDSSDTTVRGGEGFSASKVRLRRHFPIEPAFAITVHKSEGRTMERVIIALSSSSAQGCDFSFAQVHVAFSRVRRGEHIRLLLTGANETEQWGSLLYLGKLAPKKSVTYYFDGFRDAMSLDDPNTNWTTNEWSRERANANYRRRHNIPPA